MIFPVPVTLKRFLALEFVFTLGILPSINFLPLRRSPQGDAYGASSGNIRYNKSFISGGKDKQI
jgi:hypothetical protein